MKHAQNLSEEEIIAAALRLPTPEGRATYLDQACGDDEPLRQRIEALLQAHDKAGEVLDNPTADVGATTLSFATGMVPMTGKPGERIGRYRILERIGEGGCGVVYVAEQTEPVRRRVALKVIKLGMDTHEVIARFEAERQALALMDHPNIAKVLDGGATESGRPFFVMELVKGVRITDYCDKNNLSTSERLGLFIQVCHAIQHAHQKGIIHRDIKPSNILVTLHDGVPVPKVIDFGIAKATSGQRLTDKTLYTAIEQFIGTPAYMSPEQAELSGLDIDTRSDIYALGVLLYELLTGKTPFDAKRLVEAGLNEIRRIISEEEPPRPSTRLSILTTEEQTTAAKRRQTDPPRLLHLVRGDLDWIVMKTLEKDRTRRYDTANGLASDIERHLNNEPVVARPPSNLYRFQKLVRRNKLGFVAGATIAVVLVLAVVVSSSQAVLARRAERQAQDEREKAKREAERADRNAQNEKLQHQRAEAAATEANMALSTSDFLQACRFIAEDRDHDACAYLVASLRANPTNDAAVTRLATLLTYRSWLTPTLTLQHADAVKSAQFSRDGKRVVTASYDNTARVWDAQTGQPLSEPFKHAGPVNCAQFSPDGKRVVTASADATARVWDAQTGQPLTKPLRHIDPVFSAQFSPDGKRVVTASYDSTARVWDAQTGEPQTEPLKHDAVVNCAQFSPDGKRVVTASDDRTARVWDAQTGQPLTEPLKHAGSVRSAQFSLDGKRVVTASADYTARVWDAQTGQPLTQPLKHAGDVNSAQFSPDGKQVVTASDDNTARVWDVAPPPTGYSGWLLELATAICGEALNMQGVLECTNQVQALGRVRQRLSEQAGGDDWLVLGRWLLADRSTRTISPFSQVGIPDWIERRFKENMTNALAEVEQVAVGTGNAPLIERILQARPAAEQAELRRVAAKRAATVEHQRTAAASGDPQALNEFGWLFATCRQAGVRDGGSAVVFAERAAGTTGRTNLMILNTLAAAYAEAGRFADAARVQREALERSNDAKIKEAYISRLKLYESNTPYREAAANDLAPAADDRLAMAALLRVRGTLCAQFAQWTLAASDLTKAIELNPTNDWNWYQLAPLLAQRGDAVAYRQHCHTMLARYSGTTNASIAERTAKVCLMLPWDGPDLAAADKLAETAVTIGATEVWVAYYQFVKGLAEYRQGRFDSAAEWERKALSEEGIDNPRDVQACMVLAMACHQLHQWDQARAALAKGGKIAEAKLPKLESGDLGSSWHDWIIAHALMREAKGLIEGEAGGGLGVTPKTNHTDHAP